MKKIFLLLFFLSILVDSQTITEKQMINARAAGYATVAAKNPGADFSIYIIPWDGINTLEKNANDKINPGWHAQAAIKGNYFNQGFDNSDFTDYSSFVTSQEEFDKIKNVGTQWWIVCSTLPPFSDNRGKISGAIKSIENSNEGGSLSLINNSKTGHKANNWTIYNMTGDYGNGLQFWNYSADRSMYGAKLILSDSGNMSLPKGKLEAKELKVTTTPTADFVFAEDYQLPKLEGVEKHIKDKKHLPEIASAEQMQKEGVNVGEFQIKLLQKIEELTLYSIEQNKKITEQNKQLSEQNKKILDQQNQLQSQEQRIKHLEVQLTQKP